VVAVVSVAADGPADVREEEQSSSRAVLRASRATSGPLPLDEARVLLDDFLLLLPKLFALYDRSQEVDESIQVELAEYFKNTTTEASEEENELIDEGLGYEEQVRGVLNEPAPQSCAANSLFCARHRTGSASRAP
jgi:hypothetical protein